MATRFVIEYDYPGTTNGQAVGRVFVLDIERLSGKGAYSYTKNAAQATAFGSVEEAEAVIRGKRWPAARVVEVAK